MLLQTIVSHPGTFPENIVSGRCISLIVASGIGGHGHAVLDTPGECLNFSHDQVHGNSGDQHTPDRFRWCDGGGGIQIGALCRKRFPVSTNQGH